MRRRMSRYYGNDWEVGYDPPQDLIPSAEVKDILLQEIRDELKQLNRLLGCRNFLDIPTRLRAIDRELKHARKAQR